MGRRKKIRKHPLKKPRLMREDVMCMQEVELRETAEYLDLTLPRQLDRWRDHFISRERFLAAGNQWLERCCEGVRHPRIEDDVDKGLLQRKTTPSYPLSYAKPPPSAPSARRPWEEFEDDLYGYEPQPSPGWGPVPIRSAVNGHKWWTYYTPPSLPATPKIAAPSGLSNVDMATVF